MITTRLKWETRTETRVMAPSPVVLLSHFCVTSPLCCASFYYFSKSFMPSRPFASTESCATTEPPTILYIYIYILLWISNNYIYIYINSYIIVYILIQYYICIHNIYYILYIRYFVKPAPGATFFAGRREEQVSQERDTIGPPSKP